MDHESQEQLLSPTDIYPWLESVDAASKPANQTNETCSVGPPPRPLASTSQHLTPTESPYNGMPGLTSSAEKIPNVEGYVPRSRPMDTTGQIGPSGRISKASRMMWEDEGTWCFQVEANGRCVARREDNGMINGSRLLDVAGVTRGRRDGILKAEKQRHVIEIAPMHLKGVWIPLERALDLANKEKITELLYPLFVHDISALLGYPEEAMCKDGTLSAQHQRSSPKTLPLLDSWDGRQNQPSARIEIETEPIHGIEKAGIKEPVKTLYSYGVSILSSIDKAAVLRDPKKGKLNKQWRTERGRFLVWGQDLNVEKGELDESFAAANNAKLQQTLLYLLASAVSTLLDCVESLSIEPKTERLRCCKLFQCICQHVGDEEWTTRVMSLVDDYGEAPDEYEDEGLASDEEIPISLVDHIEDLQGANDCLFDLVPLIEEQVTASSSRNIDLGATIYAVNIKDKFKGISTVLANRLAEINWQRHSRIREMLVQGEASRYKEEEKRDKDSALGTSIFTFELPLPETLNNPFKEYAKSTASVTSFGTTASRFSGSAKIPPPPVLLEGSPTALRCSICFSMITISTNRDWKKHVLRDLQPYSCTSDCCPEGKRTYGSRQEWVEHEFRCHREAKSQRWVCPECDDLDFLDEESVSLHYEIEHRGPRDSSCQVRFQPSCLPAKTRCPFCEDNIQQTKNDVKLHLGRHMDEIALKALPQALGEELDGDEGSNAEFDTQRSSNSKPDFLQYSLSEIDRLADQSSGDSNGLARPTDEPEQGESPVDEPSHFPYTLTTDPRFNPRSHQAAVYSASVVEESHPPTTESLWLPILDHADHGIYIDGLLALSENEVPRESLLLFEHSESIPESPGALPFKLAKASLVSSEGLLQESTEIDSTGNGTASPESAEPINNGEIRCICGVNDDDGFTICCYKCETWQHFVCVGVSKGHVPKDYLCPVCEPRELNVEKARNHQLSRLEQSRLETERKLRIPPPLKHTQSSIREEGTTKLVHIDTGPDAVLGNIHSDLKKPESTTPLANPTSEPQNKKQRPPRITGRFPCTYNNCPQGRNLPGKEFNRKDNLTAHLRTIHCDNVARRRGRLPKQ